MAIVAAPTSLKFSASLPAAWAASVWSGIFWALHVLAISAMGWRTPVSLFTIIAATRRVFGCCNEGKSSVRITPLLSMLRLSTWHSVWAKCVARAVMLECSMGEMMMRGREDASGEWGLLA